MSTLSKQMAEMRQRIEQAKTAPKPKPRYRVRDGKIIIRMYAVLAEPKPASNVRKLLPRERLEHAIGQKCPHCRGTKVYRWHMQDRVEKCYRCNGKGVLDQRDLAFLSSRQKDNRPICHVLSA